MAKRHKDRQRQNAMYLTPRIQQGPNRCISLSRWAKKHRVRLQRVNFNVPQSDGNWRRRKEYSRWRKAVLQRDDYRCPCGAIKNLSVHHIIPVSVAFDLRYEVFNGQTLCIDCHRKQVHQLDPAFWKRMITRKPS